MKNLLFLLFVPSLCWASGASAPLAPTFVKGPADANPLVNFQWNYTGSGVTVSHAGPVSTINIPGVSGLTFPDSVINTSGAITLKNDASSGTNQCYGFNSSGVEGFFNLPSGVTPGGANTDVQFNNSGAFGGNSGFVYDGSGNTTLSGQVAAASLKDSGLTSGQLVYSNGSDVLASATTSSPLTFAAGALGCQTASGSQAGCLASTDWSTFNSKQSAITLTTTGTSGAATFVGNTLNIPNYAPGTGTVTSVSVVPANGFAGSVATSTTTPAITLSTSVNAPVLAGNGTAISAATTTGTGSTVVLATSPTLVTPALGTPASGVATNLTGLPLTTGVTGILTPANGGTGLNNSSATGIQTFAAGTGIVSSFTSAFINLWETVAMNAGDLIYGGSGGTPTQLPIGMAGQVLTVNAGATAVQWSTPSTSNVSSLSTGKIHSESMTFGGSGGTLTSPTDCSGTPCTIYSQNGSNWVTSVTRSATGSYTVNIAAGAFNTPPLCIAACVNHNYSCIPNVASSTQLALASDLLGTGLEDNSIIVHCEGTY